MIIQNIQTLFATEATSAPSLFADLAKVELYIAESYRSRAFIELLQNADDAGAHRVLIRQKGESLLVANDGRPFTRDDVIALCRSGASNKRRGDGSIGYRGIGFKSVAGIAHEIEVICRDYIFRFSKLMTQELLGIESDVPLIRIPHPITTGTPVTKSHGEHLLAEGMNTVFILSGLDHRMVTEEAQTFDESAMLFLNNVSQIEIDLPEVKRELTLTTVQRKDGLSIKKIKSGNKQQHKWLVASPIGKCEKVAFALQGTTVVPAAPERSVIHAFMPTNEFAGAQIKVNGDFSTDPSRKAVNLDDSSQAAFSHCVEILARVLQGAISENALPGIFSPFLSSVPLEGRFRKILREALLDKLSKDGFNIAGVIAKPHEVRLRPEWLSYADYEELAGHLPHVPQTTLTAHPQFADFLKWLGARTLSLEEILDLMQQTHPTPIGCAQVFCRAARQHRYDLTQERLTLLATTPLLPVSDGVIPPHSYRNEPLLPEFMEFLTQQQEIEDIHFLGKRLGLPDSFTGTPTVHTSIAPIFQKPLVQSQTPAETRESVENISLFKTPPAIKVWRSAEQNALAWLSALSDVVSAKDVSQANVGYDLEVVKRNGEHWYVEVKSVVRFGDPVRLTNNEYATAFQHGQSYLLAFVVNGSDQFAIRFIRDPIHSLALEKRCEQWSWYSDNYLDKLTDMAEK